MALQDAPTQDAVSDPVRFHDLSADDADQQPMELQSLCMNCHANGTTRILLTKIPHFKEIVLYSFECPHCDWRNNEVQFAGAYGEQGVEYTLTVPQGNLQVLSRQVVKSEHAMLRVPELDFEAPPKTQKGVVSTVEGLLREAHDGLNALQTERRTAQPEVAARLDEFLERLRRCTDGESAFTLVIDDPSGNSHVESSATAADADPLLAVRRYERTRQQAEEIGLLPQQDEEGMARGGPGAAAAANGHAPELARDNPHHGTSPVGAPAAARSLARVQGAHFFLNQLVGS